MNDFVFHNPCKVYFGEGHLGKIGPEAARLGGRALVVYGGGSVKRNGLFDSIAASLAKAGVTVYELGDVEPNPKVTSVREGLAIVRRRNVDVIVAVGGGSVIDAAKAIAVGAFYSGDPWDLVLDSSKIIASLPLIAVPTLAATGSEMDNCAVISNPDTGEKLGFASKLMVPTVAFLQPSLTTTVPAFQTAAGSADIFSHLCEVYFSRDRDLTMLDREAEGLMRTVVEFGPRALRRPRDLNARANLMWAATWAINGYLDGGKTQAWSCHAMEHELSAFYDVTHGAGLAVLTPAWMEFCLKLAEQWDKSDDVSLEHEALVVLDKLYAFGVNVWGIDPSLPKAKVASKAIKATRRWLFKELRLPSALRDLGIEKSSLADMAHAAVTHKGGLINGFVPLSERDVKKIYKSCW